MNPYIDGLLKDWATFRKTPDRVRQPIHPIARAMQTRGEFLSSGGSKGKLPHDPCADIELIYSQHLMPDLRKLLRLHYIHADTMPLDMRCSALKISETTYYRRLNTLHAGILELLRARWRVAA